MRRLAVAQRLAVVARLITTVKKALDGEKGSNVGEKTPHIMCSMVSFVLPPSLFSKRRLIFSSNEKTQAEGR
jgi:hypothetical protein